MCIDPFEIVPLGGAIGSRRFSLRELNSSQPNKETNKRQTQKGRGRKEKGKDKKDSDDLEMEGEPLIAVGAKKDHEIAQERPNRQIKNAHVHVHTCTVDKSRK